MSGAGERSVSHLDPVATGGCDREQIHIPGSIQPHGILIVLNESDLSVVQVSRNVTPLLGVSFEEAIGKPLDSLLGADAAGKILADLAQTRLETRPRRLQAARLSVGDAFRCFLPIAHRTEAGIMLELEAITDPEALDDSHRHLDGFSLGVEGATTIAELSRIAAEEVRRLTGFDRILIYRFDEDWNGTVIGEAGNGRLPSLLNHRFPASDIPAPARELYRVNRIRIIPDSGYRPVPLHPALNPLTNKPLDMSFSTLRSVSPIHVEYMKNMETAASMSVSILRNGKLWGLFACHHAAPLTVSFQNREVCDLYALMFALRLSALEHTEDFERRIEVRSAYAKLLAIMADRGDFAAALSERPDDLLAFANAQGAAVLTEGGCLLFGDTPDEDQVRNLADRLFQEVKDEIYATEQLSLVLPEASEYKEKASGLLAAAISKVDPSYLLWFRPEVIQTVQWGGNPHKAFNGSTDGIMLHPRRSFASWQEMVRDKSLPWQQSEIEAARELRNAIVGTVLRKAEELAQLNTELQQSNKDLEAFSYSVSHDLRAPLRHIVGYAEMLKESTAEKLTERDLRYLGTIIESSEYAGKLVDKLLSFSRLGRASLQIAAIDMEVLIREAIRDVMRDAEGRKVVWKGDALPNVNADLMMLRMAVRDLLSNAVKYTKNEDEAVIEIECDSQAHELIFSVKDNGVGFDMAYADKLFGVFQRLHRWEEYEGTGIGLANVRRILERHGGRTWAHGEEGKGATFFFTLPRSSLPLPTIERPEESC